VAGLIHRAAGDSGIRDLVHAETGSRESLSKKEKHFNGYPNSIGRAKQFVISDQIH
jgi:hypothetical protein